MHQVKANCITDGLLSVARYLRAGIRTPGQKHLGHMGTTYDSGSCLEPASLICPYGCFWKYQNAMWREAHEISRVQKVE
jgi:hypothetical protein